MKKQKFKVVSLFAGCGGLDLGFAQAGFQIDWANEYDKTIWKTYSENHPHTHLETRSIRDIPSSEIPDCDGIIGGPPCQSWSLAGAMRGSNDPRGQLFFEYVRILKEKKPSFFLAENVPGIISSAHVKEFEKILDRFREVGYSVFYRLLNAMNYGVPQDRTRVIVVGFKKKLCVDEFAFPAATHFVLKDTLFESSNGLLPVQTLRDAIGDLPTAVPARLKNHSNGGRLKFPNHEYMTGGFSTMYMSRNRRREWNQPSFTIQAGGRHAPLFPGSCRMEKIGEDEWRFDPKDKSSYRRMSIRECARVQTFPDDFIFWYDAISDGYKMIGNAVPVLLGKVLAKQIKSHLSKRNQKKRVVKTALSSRS